MIVQAEKLAFVKHIRKLNEKGIDSRSAFRDFATMAACACGWPNREEEYMRVIKPYDRSVVEHLAKAFGILIEEMEQHPLTDVLGPAYMELCGGNAGNGEFYTPPSVSRMMAEMNLDHADTWPKDRVVTACEPACGAGGMILAARAVMQDRGIPPSAMEWTAIDVSRTAADMCYVNMHLHGIPGVVVHGNALARPGQDGYMYGAWRTRWPAHPLDGIQGINRATNPGPLSEEERAALTRRLVEGDIWPTETATKATDADGAVLELWTEATEIRTQTFGNGSSRRPRTSGPKPSQASPASPSTQPGLW